MLKAGKTFLATGILLKDYAAPPFGQSVHFQLFQILITLSLYVGLCEGCDDFFEINLHVFIAYSVFDSTVEKKNPNQMQLCPHLVGKNVMSICLAVVNFSAQPAH